MIPKYSISGFIGMALMLMPIAATAHSFNYEYLQVDAGGSKNTMNTSSGHQDFGGKLLNLDIQILPLNNLYLRTGTMQTSFNDSSTSNGVRFNLRGAETVYKGIAGWIFPTGRGFDLRAGTGAAISQRDYTLSDTDNMNQTRDRKNRLIGEAGLKFSLPLLGEIDLIYNRLGEADYFIYESVLPLFRDIAFSSGYTYSPKGDNHSGLFSWNLGLRAYF